MKTHNGMRPQDIVILLKIATYKDRPWLMKNIATELMISASEVSESLNRSKFAGLVSADKRKLMTYALLEFLQHGLRYVFPQRPGAVVRGIATAYSAAPLSKKIHSEENVVWPYEKGNTKGQQIIPLHSSVPKVCAKDEEMYELLALTDALRIGKARERKLAIEELKEKIC